MKILLLFFFIIELKPLYNSFYLSTLHSLKNKKQNQATIQTKNFAKKLHNFNNKSIIEKEQ